MVRQHSSCRFLVRYTVIKSQKVLQSYYHVGRQNSSYPYRTVVRNEAEPVLRCLDQSASTETVLLERVYVGWCGPAFFSPQHHQVPSRAVPVCVWVRVRGRHDLKKVFVELIVTATRMFALQTSCEPQIVMPRTIIILWHGTDKHNGTTMIATQCCSRARCVASHRQPLSSVVSSAARGTFVAGLLEPVLA